MTKTTRVLGASLGTLALTVSLAACGGDSLEKSKDGGSASADSPRARAAPRAAW